MQPTNNVINIRGGGQKGENMQSHNKTSKNISTLSPSNSYTMDSMNNKLSYTITNTPINSRGGGKIKV